MIKDLISQIEAIKEQLYTKISELPDNANIKRLDSDSNCFIINSSQIIGKPFSPEYHDYKHQYKLIIKYLKTCEITNFENSLNTIIKTSIVRDGNRSVRLNPEVVKYLKTII